MSRAPKSLHVSRKEKRLLYSKVGGVPFLRLPNCSVLRDRGTLQLHPMGPSAWPSTHLSPTKFLPTIQGGSPFVLNIFGLLGPLERNHLALYHFLYFSLFLQVWIRKQSDCGYRGRRGKGKIGWNLGLGDLLRRGPLVLPTTKAFRPLLVFSSIPSSSSKLLSTQETTNLGE